MATLLAPSSSSTVVARGLPNPARPEDFRTRPGRCVSAIMLSRSQTSPRGRAQRRADVADEISKNALLTGNRRLLAGRLGHCGFGSCRSVGCGRRSSLCCAVATTPRILAEAGGMGSRSRAAAAAAAGNEERRVGSEVGGEARRWSGRWADGGGGRGMRVRGGRGGGAGRGGVRRRDGGTSVMERGRKESTPWDDDDGDGKDDGDDAWQRRQRRSAFDEAEEGDFDWLGEAPAVWRDNADLSWAGEGMVPLSRRRSEEAAGKTREAEMVLEGRNFQEPRAVPDDSRLRRESSPGPRYGRSSNSGRMGGLGGRVRSEQVEEEEEEEWVAPRRGRFQKGSSGSGDGWGDVGDVSARSQTSGVWSRSADGLTPPRLPTKQSSLAGAALRADEQARRQRQQQQQQQKVSWQETGCGVRTETRQRGEGREGWRGWDGGDGGGGGDVGGRIVRDDGGHVDARLRRKGWEEEGMEVEREGEVGVESEVRGDWHRADKQSASRERAVVQSLRFNRGRLDGRFDGAEEDGDEDDGETEDHRSTNVPCMQTASDGLPHRVVSENSAMFGEREEGVPVTRVSTPGVRVRKSVLKPAATATAMAAAAAANAAAGAAAAGVATETQDAVTTMDAAASWAVPATLPASLQKVQQEAGDAHSSPAQQAAEKEAASGMATAKGAKQVSAKAAAKAAEKRAKQVARVWSGEAGAACYACGALLQCRSNEAPGYVPPDKYEMKKRHHQLASVACTRCQLLAQGKMVAAVGGHGGYRLSGRRSSSDATITATGTDEAAERASAAGGGVVEEWSATEQYGLQEYVTAESLREQLTHLRTQKALVVKLVDILDFSGSFLTRVREMVGANPIVLVVTKIDLLPEGTSLDAIGDWIMEAIARKKLNVVAVHLCSAKAQHGLEGVAATIHRERQGRDVYVVGAANVGKSAFIGALLDEMAERDVMAAAARRRRPIASAVPGTTLGPIRLQCFSAGGDLVDTPGVHLHHRVAAALAPPDLRSLSFKRRVRGFVVTLGRGRDDGSGGGGALLSGELNEEEEEDEDEDEEGGNDRGADAHDVQFESLFWGGLARLDVAKAPANAVVTFTFYGPSGVRVHRAPAESANAVYERELGHRLTPPSAPRHNPPLWEGISAMHVVDIARDDDAAASTTGPLADIAISGLGWISVSWSVEGESDGIEDGDDKMAQVVDRNSSSSSTLQLAVRTAKGVEVFVRRPMPVGWASRDWYEFADLTQAEELNRPPLVYEGKPIA